MHRNTRALSRGVQAGNHGGVVFENLCVDVRGDSTHGVVRGRHHGDWFGHRVNSEVCPRKLGDVGEFRFEYFGTEVGAVEENVVLVGAGSAAFCNFLHHVPRNDVAGCEVLDCRCVTFHEALAVDIAEDCSLAAGAFGEEDAEPGEPGRVELEKLHVFERDSLAPDNSDTVTGQGVRVRGGLEHFPEATRREDDGRGVEHVNVARGEFVGDNTARGGLAVDLGEEQVENVELVVELDAELDAVLEERLKNHVARAVGCVARAANGRLAVVASVPAETTLVDLAVRRAVERQAHVFEVDDGVNRLARENLGGVLIDEVVATLHGVKGVPLPRILFDVGERCGHSTLRRTRVRTSWVQLRNDRRLCERSRFDSGAHSRTTRSNNDNVVFVVMNCRHALLLDI